MLSKEEKESVIHILKGLDPDMLQPGKIQKEDKNRINIIRHSEYDCPDCGHRMALETMSCMVHFAVNEDGTVGKILLNEDDVSMLRNGADFTGNGNEEFHCCHCHRSYTAIPLFLRKRDGSSKRIYKVGDEI